MESESTKTPFDVFNFTQWHKWVTEEDMPRAFALARKNPATIQIMKLDEGLLSVMSLAQSGIDIDSLRVVEGGLVEQCIDGEWDITMYRVYVGIDALHETPTV